jgi:RNA polymerase sigma factor (sigma-70 family)
MPSIDSLSLYHACTSEGSDAQIDAFEQLWRDLYRIAYAMLYSRPDADAMAADCAQAALIKIHRNLGQCRNPASFREWCAQITRRVVIDELRRPEHARRVELSVGEQSGALGVAPPPLLSNADLRSTLLAAIQQGPLSERSQRVVLGRYFHEKSDEELARIEREISEQSVQPSHIQVTRAKNMAKLRQNAALLERLRDLIETS